MEQHEDAPDRCHVFFYSPFKFPRKRPDEVVGIEVKSSWEHGLLRVTPSITENGYPLKIIGATEPRTLSEQEANEVLQHINHICMENEVEYLQKGSDTNNSSYLTPELKKVVQSLDVSFGTRDKAKIPSGYRNVTLISVANSILFNHLDKERTNEEKLRVFLCDKLFFMYASARPARDSTCLGFCYKVGVSKDCKRNILGQKKRGKSPGRTEGRAAKEERKSNRKVTGSISL